MTSHGALSSRTHCCPATSATPLCCSSISSDPLRSQRHSHPTRLPRCSTTSSGSWSRQSTITTVLSTSSKATPRSRYSVRHLRVDDSAGAALSTARRLQKDLRVLHGVDFGIQVSAGKVFAGNIGAENRYEYTVIGDPVNEAARLTDLAKSRDGRVLARKSLSMKPIDPKPIIGGRAEARCFVAGPHRPNTSNPCRAK